MKALLRVPYVDTSAAALVLSINGGERPALASLRCQVGEASIVLSVLGGSHQVVTSIGGVDLTEVVACDPAAPDSGNLPDAATRTTRGIRHDFRARVERLDDVALRAAVDDLIIELANRNDALVAMFPGDPHAVTAIALDESADADVAWTTWHAYPCSGEIVRTWTSVRAA